MSSNYRANWAPTPSGNYGSTSLWDHFFSENPTFGYQWWKQDRFGKDYWMSDFGNWADQQYGRLYAQYNAELPNRGVDFRFLDFLSELGPQELRDQFRRLTPRQRGENPEAFGGRVRWIGT